MRKYLILCILACMSLASMALATEVGEALSVDKGLVRSSARDGSCSLSALSDTAAGFSIWNVATWGPAGSAHAMYIDPAVDQRGTGGCSAPFYPFFVSSIDLFMTEYTGDLANVGAVCTYEVTLACPQDFSSGSATEDCQGPGNVFWTGTLTMVYDSAFINSVNFVPFNLPVGVCVDRPFFVVARQTGYTGTGGAAQMGWHTQAAASTPPEGLCDNWISLPAGVGYDCFLLSGFDIGYGGTCVPSPGFPACFPGAATLYVNGFAAPEMGCETVASCAARPNVYPGDDASDPIVIDSAPWTGVVDLCQFTSDYNYYFDAGAPATTTRRFTGRGGDAVLTFSYDTQLPEACFAVTLTPLCPPGQALRLRTWLTDSFGPLYWGTPQYPGINAPQTYDFTSSGLGCFFPDVYTLYVDGYPCCCPVQVDFAGDAPLAVELTSFDAVAGDRQVTLNWQTASESNIERWDITRNGEFLAEVAGLGDNESGHRYNFVDNNVVNGQSYSYTLTAYDYQGVATVFTQIETATPMAGAGVVTEYALSQNYPNPFNPTTTIEYAVREAGLVQLKVYTVDGREVATLVDGAMDAGSYSVDYDASGLASGMYLYKLSVNGFTATQKMVLMK